MEKIVYIGGKRTAFGSFGGSLKDLSGTDLTTIAAQGAIASTGLKPEHIDHVIIGQVVPSSNDGAYLARHVGLRVGVPVATPAYLVNRLCGSGFQAWVNALQSLQLGEATCVLAGGVEQMSLVPYVNRAVRFQGIRMGHGQLEDLLSAALTDQHVNMPMAMTAEKLGEKYGITRAQCDEYSYLTQQKTEQARKNGVFTDEIVAVELEGKKGKTMVDRDEHPKPDVALDKIQAMKALFKKDGLVTAATASGIVDGAVCSLITTAKKAAELGQKPLVEIKAYASVGCDPSIMGIGPAQAIRKVLAQTGLQMKDIDLFEVNEAFAAQYLAVEKELELPRERTNVNGGAIAIGHPLGASGARIMNHLAAELHRRQARYAIGSACIGGGQGIAVLIERC